MNVPIRYRLSVLRSDLARRLPGTSARRYEDDHAILGAFVDAQQPTLTTPELVALTGLSDRRACAAVNRLVRREHVTLGHVLGQVVTVTLHPGLAHEIGLHP